MRASSRIQGTSLWNYGSMFVGRVASSERSMGCMPACSSHYCYRSFTNMQAPKHQKGGRISSYSHVSSSLEIHSPALLQTPQVSKWSEENTRQIVPQSLQAHLPSQLSQCRASPLRSMRRPGTRTTPAQFFDERLRYSRAFYSSDDNTSYRVLRTKGTRIDNNSKSGSGGSTIDKECDDAPPDAPSEEGSTENYTGATTSTSKFEDAPGLQYEFDFEPQDSSNTTGEEPLAEGLSDSPDHTEIKFVPQDKAELENRHLKRIYVTGFNNEGQYIAHSLGSETNPAPITVILQTDTQVKHWIKEVGTITVKRPGVATLACSNFDMIYVPSNSSYRALTRSPATLWHRFLKHLIEQPKDIIECLIVTGDGSDTVPLLSRLRDRFNQHSTICFLHVGLGVLDHLNARVFYDPARRPTYVLGFSHYALKSSPGNQFSVVEKAQGFCDLMLWDGLADSRRECGIITSADSKSKAEGSYLQGEWSSSAKYLMKTLTKNETLQARGLPPQRYHLRLLHEIAIRSVLDPLSVLLDAPSWTLLQNPTYGVGLIKKLLGEVCSIIHASPEYKAAFSYPSDKARLDYGPLYSQIVRRSMQDDADRRIAIKRTRQGQTPNLRYLNGALIRRAREAGIEPIYNEMVLNLIRAKAGASKEEVERLVPFQ